MCDFSGKLIAWMDHELSVDETAEVERHLEACSECRGEVDTYIRVSCEFDAFCDEVIASSVRPIISRWVPVACAAGAVVALVALFLVWPRIPAEPPAFHLPEAAVAAPPAVVAKVWPASVRPIQRVHRRQTSAPARIQNANAAHAQQENAYIQSEEPVIQIAIPADEMFPPGTVPAGMHFVADLAIAADGSADGLRLRPRLAGLERRTTQP
jgi:anti-sigma factor RsiW